MRVLFHLCLLLPLWLGAGSSLLHAQVNVSGKPGLLYIPTARVPADGTFWAGATYAPQRYSFRMNGQFSETIYFVNLALLPRLELNINLLNMNGNIPYGQRGIGDRQIDVKYAFLTEKKFRPSAAFILSAPFGIDNSLETIALVATKNLNLGKRFTAEVTAGMGSPYYVFRDERNLQNRDIFSGFSFRDKRERSYRYLAGPFGGVALRYQKKAGLLAEWDSQHFNAGAYVTLFRHWTLQAGLLNGDQWTLGTSYAVSLFGKSKNAPDASTNP